MTAVEELKERARKYYAWIRCQCGELYHLLPQFVLALNAKHICPKCNADVLETGEPIEVKAELPRSKKLLPEGVRQIGKGIHTRYEANDPELLEHFNY